MPPRRAPAAALALWLATSAASPAGQPAAPGVIGQDDRVPLSRPMPELAAVGRVNQEGGGGFCTGTLVAPDRVLTAARCLWDARRRRALPAGRLHFVAGWRRGAHLGHARARTIEHDPTLRLGGRGTPADPLTDWAVLVLERPLARPDLRPLPFAGAAERLGAAEGAPLARVGYGRDRPHLPVVVEPCRVLGAARQGRLLLHDCDAAPGDAGSPILVRAGTGYALIGSQTSVATTARGPVGVAVVVAQPRALPSGAIPIGPRATQPGGRPATLGAAPFG
ncbi:MAG TPA: trypsin-like peptidase domain-containing protein [Geminicoccaceae bacterium]|nr:trypsin-like peptidase domain-containing protein [Geminicoccaceae bacterium]